MRVKIGNILKRKTCIPWIGFMTLIIWSCSYYLLFAEREFNIEKQVPIKQGKCLCCFCYIVYVFFVQYTNNIYKNKNT